MYGQFVNSYASFFYIAFIAEHLPDNDEEHPIKGHCGSDTCMVALAINLAVVFGAVTITKVAALF